jgi:hypothetical protein
MLRLKHSVRLVQEVGAYAARNRAWWVLLVVPVAIVGMTAVATTHAVVPYAVYTLF